MATDPAANTPRSLHADELRRALAERDPSELLLVDVREPAEYERGHLPGALLVPLFTLAARVEELRRAPGALIVFYCQHGARSQRAAQVAVEALGAADVAVLTGGISAWSGEVAPGLPDLRAFTGEDTIEDALVAALDLEKGAHRFYDALSECYAGTPFEPVLRRLAAVEVGHEQRLYLELCRVSTAPVPPLEVLLDKLRGDVLETGEALGPMLERTRHLGRFGIAALLEVALELELRAFDTYRALARRTTEPDLRRAFDALATEERDHAAAVLAALAAAARDDDNDDAS